MSHRRRRGSASTAVRPLPIVQPGLCLQEPSQALYTLLAAVVTNLLPLSGRTFGSLFGDGSKLGSVVSENVLERQLSEIGHCDVLPPDYSLASLFRALVAAIFVPRDSSGVVAEAVRGMPIVQEMLAARESSSQCTERFCFWISPSFKRTSLPSSLAKDSKSRFTCRCRV